MSDVLACWFGTNGFDKAAQGVLGEARRLADALGGKLHAVILGAGDDGSGVAAVADSVRIVDALSIEAYSPETALATLTPLAKELSPAAVILSNDTYCQELAPRLAHRLGGSAVGDASALQTADGRIRATRAVYGGKAIAVVELKKAPAVVWIRARAFAAAEPRGATASIQRVAAATVESKTKLVARESEAQEGVRLEDARFIVSGGRGLGGPEPFALLRSLADVMGAEVAASRAACDSGWVPPTWQVGQTGKKVAPELYLAVAISGASQHLIGIADAKNICAINTDPNAPIFKHCRFGLVEDYKSVVDLLRQKLAAMKG